MNQRSDTTKTGVTTEPEVSVVMPCLNEAETLETCINKARRFFEEHDITGEIVVADNGSTDDSVQIAQRAGARVVHAEIKGYGSALMAGFAAARGRYLIMGDADDSYDFLSLIPFVEKLREGYDLVMGSRFRGGITRGAMPWLHRYVGNPLLTGILNLFFRTGVSDAHCGLRALTREALERLNLRTAGMEFASEMVVKAAVQGLRIAEVPTTLSPAGRSRPPHLRSFRDGWRHLRFMMVLCPTWTLMIPGAAMMFLGAIVMALLCAGPVRIGPATLDIHTMMLGAMMFLVGCQALTTGVAARIYAWREQLGTPDRDITWWFRYVNLERGVVCGLLLAAAGLAVIVGVTWYWADRDFGDLDPVRTMRPLIIGTALVALGAQTVLMSFFYSMLGIEKK